MTTRPATALTALIILLLTACTPPAAADTPTAIERERAAGTTVHVDVTLTLHPDGGTYRQRGHLRPPGENHPAEADLVTTGPGPARHHITTGGHQYNLIDGTWFATPAGEPATPYSTVYAGTPIDILDLRIARALLAGTTTTTGDTDGALHRTGTITVQALIDATGNLLHPLPFHIAPAALAAPDATITWQLWTGPDHLPRRLHATAPVGATAPEGFGVDTTMTLDVRYLRWGGHYTITTPSPTGTVTLE